MRLLESGGSQIHWRYTDAAGSMVQRSGPFGCGVMATTVPIENQR